MKTAITKTLLLFLLFACFFGRTNAQGGLCPPNLDFEFGDFSNWVCRTGSVILSNGVNKVTWTATGQVNNRHTIIPAATAGTDFYGGFSRSCPNGSGYSVQLGNSGGGHEAENISYTYTIPATATVFSILFNYAVVFQDPNHLPEEQPRFRAKITDLTTNSPIPCVTFDFTASATLPGFRQSRVDASVYYKDWTPVTINLSTFAGRTIMLEFTTSDCVFTQHFGYAYVDVNSTCNGAIQGNTVCIGDESSTLTAPFGFQNYTWFADPTFTTILSNTQTLTLTPPPTVGTVFPVIVEPFAGFGCKDTLYTNIAVAPKPSSFAGIDKDICRGEQVQVGAPSVSPINTYSWTPAMQVSNPSSPNPMASLLGITPTEFHVKTTDILTGCFSYDTVLVTGRQADTTLAISGRTSYCVGETSPGILSVSNLLVAVQWYDGNTPIPGATGYIYQPAASGDYWAQVKQLGCTDSTRRTTITINPIPASIAGADVNICINQTKQIGGASTTGYNYSWIPAAQVSDANIANPQAWAIGNSPQQFIVHTTVAATGCNAYDTVIITGLVMDTTLTIAGKADYCEDDPAKGVLSVNNSLQSVQWYEGTTAISGAANANFQPTISGNYWALLKQAGCTDSSRTIAWAVHPIPVADFELSSDSACLTNAAFTFTNRSAISDGSALTYIWRLSDGSTQTTLNAVKTFTAPGRYKINLTTTSPSGCTNTTADSTIYVMPNGKAAFTWDSICINRPVQFTNLSSENGSPLLNYYWNFSNGGSYSIKNPPPITYTAEGLINVALKLIALGCENFPDSAVRTVQVNKAKAGVSYRSITVPQGIAQFIHARDTVGRIYNWRPRVHLSNYAARFTEFYADGGDVKYLIDITDPHTCITTDTLLMQVLKKPGYYLPTAFTPNGDGLNDVAVPYLVGMKGLRSFSVFNRWGNRVFYTTRYEHGWDGRLNGKMQDIAVYVWVLEFYDSNNQLVIEKGTIAIVK